MGSGAIAGLNPFPRVKATARHVPQSGCGQDRFLWTFNLEGKSIDSSNIHQMARTADLPDRSRTPDSIREQTLQVDRSGYEPTPLGYGAMTPDLAEQSITPDGMDTSRSIPNRPYKRQITPGPMTPDLAAHPMTSDGTKPPRLIQEDPVLEHPSHDPTPNPMESVPPNLTRLEHSEPEFLASAAEPQVVPPSERNGRPIETQTLGVDNLPDRSRTPDIGDRAMTGDETKTAMPDNVDINADHLVERPWTPDFVDKPLSPKLAFDRHQRSYSPDLGGTKDGGS